MEQIDLLREIAANTAPKESINLNVSGTSTRLTTRFDTPIELDREKEYEIALVGLETYYSFPNIDSKRNAFKWSPDAGVTWHDYSLPIGAYELDDINEAIQKEIVKKGGTKSSFNLQPNKVTLKTIMKLTNNVQIDFNVDNSLRTVLGFDAKIYDQAYVESEKTVDILNVNTIHIKVDIISGSYVDGVNKPIIYSFFPNVSPGYKIVEKPTNLIYLPVHVSYIPNMTVSITDQDDELLDLRGERVSIRFNLRNK